MQGAWKREVTNFDGVDVASELQDSVFPTEGLAG